MAGQGNGVQMITPTSVIGAGTVLFMAGAKPPNFTPEQTAVLLAVVKAMASGNQTAIAKILGVKQQTVSGYFSGKGFSYQTGTKIAVEAGFPGLDAMFAAHGVAPKGVAVAVEIPGLPTDMPPMKRLAVKLALQAGASPRAILHLCTAPEWTAPSMAHNRPDWWISRMVEATRPEDVAIPDAAGLAAEKGQKTKSRNAAAKAAKEARHERQAEAPGHSSSPPSRRKAAG